METYDVFLCHSSEDKRAVRLLSEALASRGLRVWLDERELVPGRPWQVAVENAIRASKAIAVVFGPDRNQRWQEAELRAAISQFIETGQPVIPVLLPSAPEELELPLFLRAFQLVDLRKGLNEAGLDLLEWGIRGRRINLPSLVFTSEATKPLSLAGVVDQSIGTRLPEGRSRTLSGRSSRPMFTGVTLALVFLLLGIAIGVWKAGRSARSEADISKEPTLISSEGSQPIAPRPATISTSDSPLSRPQPDELRRLETCGGKPLLTAVKIMESACAGVGCDFELLRRLDVEVDKTAFLVALSGKNMHSVFLYFEDGGSQIEDILDWPAQLEQLDELKMSIEEPDNSIVFVVGKASSGGSFEHNIRISRDRARSVLEYLKMEGVKCRQFRAGSLGASPLALSLADADILGIPPDSYRRKKRILNQSVFVFVYPCADLVLDQ